MSDARGKTYELLHRLGRVGINATFEQADILRRAELTLTRCHERECGDGSNYYLERDDETGKTYNVHIDTGKRSRCPDRETGAIRRIAEVCEPNGLHYYVQGDPRGAALWVSADSLSDTDYTRGVCCGIN